MKQQENPHDFFKPLQVPANYNKHASIQDQVVFALAYLGEATSNEVASKLHQLNPDENKTYYQNESGPILQRLYDSGLINQIDRAGQNYYNLNKEVIPHDGKVDPDKLDVG